MLGTNDAGGVGAPVGPDVGGDVGGGGGGDGKMGYAGKEGKLNPPKPMLPPLAFETSEKKVSAAKSLIVERC